MVMSRRTDWRFNACQGALEALHLPLEGVVQAQGRGELL
jgi:hypothetical protein